jgi:hypothetical protein
MSATNNIGRKPQAGRRTWRQRQEFVVGKLLENKGNGIYQPMGAIMLEAGYPPATARNPQQLTRSKTFQELLEDAMPDVDLAKIHKSLLRSNKLDHMVFPLGPKGEDDANFSGARPDGKPEENAIEKAGIHVERTTLTDGEIKGLIAEVGGTVRRIVHGETARHVYFWAPNDKARHDALKLAYDLKGKLNLKEPPLAGDTYNTFIQQNNFDPNSSKAQDLVKNTLVGLMDGTKRKVIEGEAVNVSL